MKNSWYVPIVLGVAFLLVVSVFALLLKNQLTPDQDAQWIAVSDVQLQPGESMQVACAEAPPCAPTDTPTPLSPTDTPTPPTATATGTPPPSLACDYVVAMSGNDNNPGTEAQPFRTIVRGISGLAPGDTLCVKTGSYPERLQRFPSGESWERPIRIMAYPGERVVVNPAADRCVDFSQIPAPHHIILDGFVFDATRTRYDAIKFQYGSSAGHHIRIANSEVFGAPMQGILVTVGGYNNEFINLHIHDNGTSEYHHGIYISDDENLVEGCTIHDNAGNGVQVYSGSGTPDNNTVRGNKIFDNGTAGLRSRGVIFSIGSGNLAYNNLIWGNKIGIQTFMGTSHRIYNNTIYGNTQYGLHLEAPTTARNNILYQNAADWGTVGGSTLDHNLVGIDPQFIDASAHDFHLVASSSAVDAGVALGIVLDDFDGTSRPQGQGYDVGAFEQ